MKRFVCLAISLGLTGLTLADTATASSHRPVVKKHVRTLTLTYTGSAAVHTVGSGAAGYCHGATTACLVFDTYADERYITISSTDAAGRPVGLTLNPANQTVTKERFFCGATADSRVTPNQSWRLQITTLSLDAACPAAATKGSFTVRISNLP